MIGDKDFHAQLYGANAAEWLRRWDANEFVWSIEMGGLGPGYEQCIQLTVGELIRYYLKEQISPDVFTDTEKHKAMVPARDKEVFAAVDHLGLSGAQYGAACSLAHFLYCFGPVYVMTDEHMKDRQIQVRKAFPNLKVSTNATA